MKSILVTGGAGFIGSNFISCYLAKHADTSVVNLDKLTYAGDLENLAGLQSNPNYKFVRGDISDRELLKKLFGDHQFQGVIHLAAESHVDRSIESPSEFIRTNILGTFQLLDVAREHWMSGPHKSRPEFSDARFLHVSTDEVYGSLGVNGMFTETSAYAPNSPYSASKASSDHLVRSYFHTYGLNTVTTNCSNNYGPRQHQEKFIPTVIRTALAGQAIPIYGTGMNVRDWLYVGDHCAALDLIFSNGVAGESYNIGTRNEQDNLSLARLVCSILDEVCPRSKGGSYDEQIQFVADRAGHDFRYAIDPSKLETTLGWRGKYDFRTNLKNTVEYYVERFS